MGGRDRVLRLRRRRRGRPPCPAGSWPVPPSYDLSERPDSVAVQRRLLLQRPAVGPRGPLASRRLPPAWVRWRLLTLVLQARFGQRARSTRHASAGRSQGIGAHLPRRSGPPRPLLRQRRHVRRRRRGPVGASPGRQLRRPAASGATRLPVRCTASRARPSPCGREQALAAIGDVRPARQDRRGVHRRLLPGLRVSRNRPRRPHELSPSTGAAGSTTG